MAAALSSAVIRPVWCSRSASAAVTAIALTTCAEPSQDCAALRSYGGLTAEVVLGIYSDILVLTHRNDYVLKFD